MKIKVNIYSLILFISYFIFTFANNYVFANENDKVGVYGFYLGSSFEDSLNNIIDKKYEASVYSNSIPDKFKNYLKDKHLNFRPDSNAMNLDLEDFISKFISPSICDKLGIFNI